MNLDLSDRLLKHQEEGKSFRVGVIGAGKFATMFLSQANSTSGFNIAAIADLNIKRAEEAIRTAGFEQNLNTVSYTHLTLPTKRIV